jgi:hypothetical protein
MSVQARHVIVGFVKTGLKNQERREKIIDKLLELN